MTQPEAAPEKTTEEVTPQETTPVPAAPTPSTPTTTTRSPRRSSFSSDADLRLMTAVDTLVADGESETTLLALLSTEDGSPIEGERVRFILQDGNAFLGERGNEVAVDAEELANGLYFTKLRAGTVEGSVTISAVWVSAPDSPLPQTDVSIDLVTAETLRVEVDDEVVLGDAQDEATIIAYLLDGLNRPVNNADVTFRLVSGSGTVVEESDEGVNGRYAATYRPGNTPGEAAIEVALPTNTQTLREEVTIEIVEAVAMDAFAFPEVVGRRSSGQDEQLYNTATILVPVRDGDGDLVRNLEPTELVAQVVEGPGEVIGPVEIELANGQASGVYKWTFIADGTTGSSTIRVINLDSPSRAVAETTVETVTQVNPSRTELVEIFTIADDPFYSDGASQAAVIMFAADRSGNAVTGLGDDLEVNIIKGQGSLNGVGVELGNLAGTQAATTDAEQSSASSDLGSGVYLATLTSGVGGVSDTTLLRATFVNSDGTIETQEHDVALEPLGAPRIVVFPERIPASRNAVATIDVFDFDTRGLDDLNTQGLVAARSDVRYRVEIDEGPGRITGQVENRASDMDLIADDNVSTAVFESDQASGADQETILTVIDLAASGYPQQDATVEIGQAVSLTALQQPLILDQGDDIQIIAFAQDEFGLPALDHDLRITVVSGSGQVLDGGRMVDNGVDVEGFKDPFENDGMYVGAVRATGTTGDNITVRITDLTSPDQPEIELDIEVGE